MKLKTLLFFLALACSACVPPPLTPKPKAKNMDKEAPKAAVKDEALSQAAFDSSLKTVIIKLHPSTDAFALAKYLKDHPNHRLTILFPPQFFDDADRKKVLSEYRTLASSKQIEVGLTLDNNPILPLLGNLKLAEETEDWKFDFSWPEDISAQIARASAAYQRRWGFLPSGLYPPYGALSEETVQALRQFRLNWTLSEPDEDWGIKFFGATAVLKPPVASLDAGAMIRLAADRPFVYFDLTQAQDPGLVLEFLKALRPAAPLSLGSEFAQSLRDDFTFPKSSQLFRTDYFEWVHGPQQKKIWQALSEVREVIHSYKNSGRANLKLLDAAVEEMSVAESGAFILDLGRDDYQPDQQRERNFVATLAGIYRLTGQPVPESLNSLFSGKTMAKTTAKTTENDRPFFVEGPQSLTWNDPSGDDNGSGTFVYPAGKFPKGAFDLREVEIAWTDESIEFTLGVVTMPSQKISLVMPLFDIYIDINRLPGAGATQPLKKRNGVVIESQAAWEYALSVSPESSVSFQSIPGSDPRTLSTEKTRVEGNTYVVSFPRSILRGEPDQWRFSIGLMGAETGSVKDEGAPAAVLNQATPVRFGGAMAGRTASPFIDILASTNAEQARRISAYENGGKVVLPFVDPE